MNTVKGIFFDLGWTLERPAADDWNRTRMFYEYYPDVRPENYEPQIWQQANQKAQDIILHNHLLHGLAEEMDIFTRYYMTLVNSLPDCSISEDVARIIAHDHTYQNENYIALEGAETLLRTLRSQGYRTGIISDTFPSVENSLRHISILDLFDTYTYSFAFGVFKPSPIMYEDALKQMNLPADQTIFIDDLSMNLAGAEAFGIRGIQSLAMPGSVSDGIHPFVHKPMDLLEILQTIQISAS